MSKMKWFSTWFDSPYYHILYDQRDENEASAFIKAIQQKLKTPKNTLVLDAACGQGRHAKTLHELGVYEWVCNFFTSFGYFDVKSDNQAAFDSLSAALKPGGVFLMDFFNPTYVLNHLVGQETVIKQGISFEINRWAKDGFLYKSIDFTDQKETFHFEEKVELISQSDFLEYAFNSGLTWTGMLGDYQLNSFDDQNSPRMIFLWTKN